MADVFVVVFGLACVALGLTAGRAWPTARAVERWLDNAEEMAADLEARTLGDLEPMRDLWPPDDPAGPLDALHEASSSGVLADLAAGGVLEPAVRLPSAVERAAMYDTLTNDPPGPPNAPTLQERAGGHQRAGTGRADRRNWHKHRGTLAQAETEAHALVWRMRDRAREQESAAFWGELADLRDAARAHLAAWPDWQAAA